MSRRILTVFPTLAVLAALGCAEPVHVERGWTVMGTYASAEVYARTRDGAELALEDVRQAYERVDAVMSNWKEDSELSRLNRRAADEPYTVQDPDLFRCIRMALQYAKATRGAFDPTVGPLMRAYGFRPRDPKLPDERSLQEALRHVGWEKVDVVEVASAVRFKDPGVELDLGGIAKGYALDVAARAFARVGCEAGLLDLGGNLYAWNHPPGAPAWTVGIRNPLDPSKVMATVQVASRAVATSGTYENAFVADGREIGHIMEAGTGLPARSDVIAATAIADGGADADALSTAMFVAGSKAAGSYLRRARRVEAVLVVDGRDGPVVLASASLKGSLEVDRDFLDAIGGRVRYVLPPEKLDTAEVSDLWERLID